MSELGFNIDFADGTTASAAHLEEAIRVAEASVGEHGGAASVFDRTDKRVAFVMSHVTQTLQTDPD